MMRALFSNDSGKTGWFDHLLSTIAGSLVLYCVGMAVSRPDVGNLLLGLFILGNFVSWILSATLERSRLIVWDGIVYLGMVGLLFFSFGSLGKAVSDDPFLGIFSSVGFLSWMLVFGSFAAWRDSTLLFQAVPGIAMFGLIGCYDTFRSVTYYFFAFLLCIATLFARINARNMLDYAVRSGAAVARSSPDESPLVSLRKGPWRSVAGPTWALLSAGIIVVLSLVSAPLVQQSVQGVVGHFKLPIPPSNRGPNAVTPFFHSEQQGSVQVGLGPVQLAAEPVLRIQMDEPRFLRSSIYQYYTGHGWSKLDPNSDSEAQRSSLANMTQQAKAEVEPHRKLDFTIEMLTARGGVLPVPGEVLGITGNPDVQPATDGTYSLRPGASLNVPFVGTSLVPVDPDVFSSAERNIPELDLSLWTSTGGLPQDVIDLVRKVTEKEKTDAGKANAIRMTIAQRIVYDQQAEAVPEDRDAVQYTLFSSHRGYCDVFASSMVMMARAAGIPARYVTGFYPFSPELDSAGRMTIHESDAHAWAELYFKGVGWRAFDATEGAQEADGRGRGESTSGFAWLHSAWFSGFVEVAFGALSAILVVFLANRSWVRPARDVEREKVARLYLRFNSALARQSGKIRLPEQTPEEYLAAIAPLLYGQFGEASALTQVFLGALFGTSVPSYEELAGRVRAFERAKVVRPPKGGR
jgi:transglutaminase-like putative cysteine protease